ncbi:MAG: hypothetical protein JWO59_494, partial [Chloroflexi bacterium]|nr:hypothetical protein [Chloroflexota bacterium]
QRYLLDMTPNWCWVMHEGLDWDPRWRCRATGTVWYGRRSSACAMRCGRRSAARTFCGGYGTGCRGSSNVMRGPGEGATASNDTCDDRTCSDGRADNELPANSHQECFSMNLELGAWRSF